MRVFLGPSEVAGILWGYRQGLRQLGVDAKVVTLVGHRFGYPADVDFDLKGNIYLRTLQSIPHLPKLIAKFDLFHFIMGKSLLPHPYNLDIPFLKLLRKKVVMSFVGSDIRCSEEVLKGHKSADDCHECFFVSESGGKCNIEKKLRLVKFWSRNADAIFSGVELFHILDALSVKYYHAMVPCDLSYWKPFESDFYQKEKEAILVLHAPTEKRIKGEKIVVGTMQRLRDEGLDVNLKLLTGVPNFKLREWLNVSDIVVDQLLAGWHGMFAVESMAMAKPTICFINEEYKRKWEYAKDLPLVSATPDTLYEKLKMLIENPNLRKAIGYKSRKYVEKVHDCKKVAKHLFEVYQAIC